MSNHIHLLIREREDTIGMAIKRIASSYVYYYNHKYSRDGHLFRERFKSEPVNDMARYWFYNLGNNDKGKRVVRSDGTLDPNSFRIVETIDMYHRISKKDIFAKKKSKLLG